MNIITKIQADLLSLRDQEYKVFSSSLMPTVCKDSIIGIRVPILRKYAKSVSGDDAIKFLSNLPHTYFEENNLHAFLIERITDFDECIAKLEEFLPYVNNWATCDSMRPKVLKSNCEKLIPILQNWLKSDKVYVIRYAIGILLSFYLDQKFQPRFLKWVANVKNEDYYVMMMQSWYFATALAKQWDAVLPYFQNKLLSVWVHNKSIQKAIESYRVTFERKTHLKSLKIK